MEESVHLKLINERSQKAKPTNKNMCHMWTGIFMEKKMEKKLG